MNKIKTHTLGCKVNQYETEFVKEAFHQIGYIDANEHEIADLVIVNTCTVTAQSDLKSRKAVRKLAKENPGAEVVVMGCLATRDSLKLAEIPGVSEIITDKREINAFLKSRGVLTPPTGISSFGERHRAFVKVQDGCVVGCAYCIIPKVRPYLSSRNQQEVLDEIQILSDKGFAEIVLTGIHLGHYGVDLVPKTTLADLVSNIVELIERKKLEIRIRISSLEAVETTGELVRLVRDNPTLICPHFHLSMQSGSDAVLAKMKRRWMSGPFFEKCEEIKAEIADVALTTDVIVGFPGETESQFIETSDMVRKIGFSKIHVFRFSAREGTEAADMPGQIPFQIKRNRSMELARIADEIRKEYAQTLVGKTVQVLCEMKTSDGRLSGTADRYLTVTAPMDGGSVGRLCPVDLKNAIGEELFG